MTLLRRSIGVCALTLVLAIAWAGVAQAAPTAKITAMVLSVQHRSGSSGNWATSKVGTLLPAGSRVRTGARSKAELRFPDGSVVRMGPRSDLVLQAVTDRQMQLKYGTLWGKFIAGNGARIQGGSAVAAVKGTELDYSTTQNKDGTFTDICTVYETKLGVDFITSAGITPLKAGTGSKWRGQPFNLPGGTTGLPDGGQPQPGQTPGGPPPANPAPPQQFAGGDLYVDWSGLQTGKNIQTTPGGNAGFSQKSGNYTTLKVINDKLPGTFGQEEGDLHVIVNGAEAARRATSPIAMAQLPRAATSLVEATIGQTPSRELFGRRFYGPYISSDVYGLWGETGSIIGGRIRPSAVIDDWYVELGANFWNDLHGGWDGQLSEAFGVYRSDNSEIMLGRQHFLEGPVNNSDLGTILGFDTIDAARIKQRLDDAWTVDLGVVFDYLPFSSEATSGAYLRAQTALGPGQLGINCVYDDEFDLGFSTDLAWPLVPGEVDIYGEYGNNSEKKALSTIGVYFPGLYQSTGVDVFIERATRHGEANLWSLVAYRDVTDDLTGVLVIEKQSGEDPDFSVGGMWEF